MEDDAMTSTMATSSQRMQSFSETHGTFLCPRRVVDNPTHGPTTNI